MNFDIARRLAGRVGGRLHESRSLAVMLWRAGGWRAAGAGLLFILQGLAPIAIIVATGLLVETVPGVVAHGMDSPEGTRALLAVAAVIVAFLGRGICDALAGYAQPALASLYAMAIHDTVARSTARPSGIAALEDPAVAAELAAVHEYDQAGVYRMSIWSLQGLLSRRTQAVAVFVILVGFRWWTGLVLLLGWRCLNWAMARWVHKGAELGHVHRGTDLRRAQYLRSLAMDGAHAKEVRVFGLADWFVQRYTDTWLAAMTELWRGRRTSWPGTVVASVVLAAALAAVLGAVAWAGLRGEISVAALAVLVQAVLVSEYMGPLGDRQWVLGQVRHGAHQVRRLEVRLGEHDQPPPASSPASHRPVEVCLRDVRFTYPGRTRPTIHDVSLRIPAGQSLALVGVNGSGKTTLIKLLCGLYRPDSGQITVDGADPTRTRPRIGVIFQSFVRYELPLRMNVGYGDLTLVDDRDALSRALADAGGGDLPHELPAGWDTVLARGYDGGAELSGGQWQKVALARALTALRGGAGLLVLDEPAANLDVRAEQELFDRLLTVTRGVTTIIVTQRLATVRQAERIVVVSDGRIVEDGTHVQLLAAGGQYARMYQLQAERFAVAEPADGGPTGAALRSGSQQP